MKKIFEIFLTVSLIFSFGPLSANAATFTKYGQDVTAYSASQYKPDGTTRKTASGLVPKAGYVAMRSDAPVAFGSTVITPYAIMNGDGSSYSSYLVQDRGVSTSLSQYAIDIWWGFCRTTAYTGSGASALNCSPNDTKFIGALDFGRKTMNLQFLTK